MKKILVFSLAYYPDFVGGAEVAIKEITDRIPPEEALFDMVTAKMNFKQKRFEKIGNVNVYRVGLGIETFDKFSIPIFGFLKAVSLQRKNKYDISWCMMANQVSVTASFFKLFYKSVPLVLTIQEGDEEEHLKRYVFGNDFLYKILIRPWHKMPFKLSNRATAISFYLKERIERNNFKGTIEIIPNGVDLKTFPKKYSDEALENLREELGIKQDEGTIITTSRLVEKNAIEDIILSLKHLPKKYKLLILGTGHLLYKLQNLTEREGLFNRVKFLGFVERHEMSKYLQLSNVFVRPSLSEGQGISFIEAMASGVPVIATPVGGITDFLKDRETGLFCEVRNPESIAERVKLLEKDSELKESIVAKAKELSKGYSWDKIAKMMLNKAFSGFSKDFRKIVIATGIYPPQTGGPAYYAKSLNDRWVEQGHLVKVVTYSWEKKFPPWIKHLIYLSKLIINIRKVDFILALDTYLTATPALWAGKIFGKKILVRTGGDFLWEMYVNRTKEDIIFSDFYKEKRNFSFKEKIIFRLTRSTFKNLTGIIFSTKYQRDIFTKAYNLNTDKNYIVENSYRQKEESLLPQKKNFLWAGRDIPLKNITRLKKAFKKAQKENSGITLDIMRNPDHELLMEKIKSCYVFVLPSLSDVSPNLILRSIGFNKPFICTRETGIKERIKDIGLFINPLDEQDIKEKILFLAGNENYEEQKRKIENFNFTHSYRNIAEEILIIASSCKL